VDSQWTRSGLAADSQRTMTRALGKRVVHESSHVHNAAMTKAAARKPALQQHLRALGAFCRIARCAHDTRGHAALEVGGVAVRLRDDLEQMAVGVVEVDATAAEVMVDAAGLLLGWIGPNLFAALADSGEC
jgi:hypothetical protein